jgi:hypothetical protein
MTSINNFTSQLAFTGAWFIENPLRIQMAIVALSMVAVAVMVILGVSATSVLFAGPAPGGSGGSG